MTPNIRSKCLKSLYRACASHALLPKSLQVELCDSLVGDPTCRGGFGDVWKREYRGQDVAVKVLRKCTGNDLQNITRVSHSHVRIRRHADRGPCRGFARNS